MRAAIGRWVAAVCLLVCGAMAEAALPGGEYAVVDSVQMPAWLERHGQRLPLAPGFALHNRDRVVTGAQGRVAIALAEGSAVKIGENAQLDLNALGRRERGVFTAALDVARGAFRFTTGVFSRLRGERAVNVRVATLTAGIRGTDLWGSADDERDLFCLLEGRITVVHALDKPRELSAPLSFYAAPKGQAPKPVEQADPAQVAQWAAQTEILAGGGYAQRGGKWAVELAVFDNQPAALALYDRVRAAGYAVRIKPRALPDGAYVYRLRVTQLPTRGEAEVLAERFRQLFDLRGAKPTR